MWRVPFSLKAYLLNDRYWQDVTQKSYANDLVICATGSSAISLVTLWPSVWWPPLKHMPENTLAAAATAAGKGFSASVFHHQLGPPRAIATSEVAIGVSAGTATLRWRVPGFSRTST